MSRETLQARKELLQMRAAIERLEMGEQLRAVRVEATPGAVWRAVWPRLLGRISGRMGGRLGARLAGQDKKLYLAFDLLRRYPIISSVVSVVAAKKGLGAALRVLKWGGLSWAGYSAYRAWARAKVAELNEQDG